MNFLIWNKKLIKTHFYCRLLNLLKQYGGLEEYMKFNTLTQNDQQLKNFDLSEYRQVIFTTIIVSYQQIIQQIQEIIKVHIVPAILDYDEMARGKQKGNASDFLEFWVEKMAKHGDLFRLNGKMFFSSSMRIFRANYAYFL